MKYAGLDVHAETVVICIVDAAGVKLHTAIVPTTKTDVIAGLRAVRGPLAVAFEEGPLAGWLRNVLVRRVARVLVCDPRRNHLLKQGSRSDRIDAAAIAELLRLGALRPVYHGDDAVERLRVFGHHYDALTRDIVRVKLRLRAVFRSQAIPTDGEAFYNPRKRASYLKRLSRRPAEQARAKALFRQLDALAPLKQEAKTALVAHAAAFPAFPIIQSFPCVGEVRAALFIAMVGSPDRFPNRRCFWKYAGSAVRHHGTGEHDVADGKIRRLPGKTKALGLEKHCNGVLKRVLRETAVSIASGRGAVRAHYDRAISRGKSPAVARTALARKIAATLLALWRSMQPFDPAFFTLMSRRSEEASLGPFSASP